MKKAHPLAGRAQSPEHVKNRVRATMSALTKTTKTCAHCGEAFAPTSLHQKYCSGRCWNIAHRVVRPRRRLHRLRVSADVYARLIAIYRNQCQICGKAGSAANGRGATGRLAVDHAHGSDEIRGLLCHRCNTALGLLNDSPEIAHQAFRYLAYHGSTRKATEAV